MTEKLGVNEKEPAFGQKTPTTTTTFCVLLSSAKITGFTVHFHQINITQRAKLHD